MSGFIENLNILVLEEGSEDFFIIKDYLKEQFANSKIQYVKTCLEAELFLQQNIDLQILLVDLPRCNTAAEQLVKQVLQFSKAIPVVALTTFSNKDFGFKLTSLGVSDYLFKDGLTSIYLYKIIIDSIERNRIYLKLNESEENYKKLFRLNPFPYFVYDINTLKFLDINEAAIKHYGYSREEFVSMTIEEIRPPEDIPILYEIIVNRDNPKKLGKTIVRHCKKNGEIISVKIESNWIKFEGKEARLVMALDITENLKAQQELKESEYRFKALVQEGSDLIVIMDIDGVCNYVSPTIEALLGIMPNDLLGHSAFDYVHKDDLERILSEFDLLKVKKRIETSPFRFLDGNKQYRWLESVITDMSDDNVIAGIVVNSRDITERIENEIKTKESIDRYTAVSKATSDAIYEWDFKTNVVKWNKGIKGIFGYKNITETDFTWWMTQIHPEDERRVTSNLINFVKKKKERWQVEYRFRGKDGCYKHVLDRSFVIYNEEGEPFKMIGSMQDITRTVYHIKEIEDHNKRLKEISWTQSHKVRAPLARIMGLLEIFKHYPHTDEDLIEMLDYITISANELDEIICSIINSDEQVKKI